MYQKEYQSEVHRAVLRCPAGDSPSTHRPC